MSRVEWDDSLSVKIKEIDEQHKTWIGIINKLHDCMIDGTGLTEIGRETLKAMEEYGAFHFSFEESYMERIGYADLPGHKKEHEAFLKRIRDLVKQEQEGELVLNSEIMNMLIEWLLRHIQVVDKKYSQAS